MAMSDLKKRSRTALHAAMAEPCIYHDRDLGAIPSVEQSAEGLALSARFKSKLKAASAEDDGVSILENVESLIFNSDQIAALGIELDAGTIVEFPGYEISFRLDMELDRDGPCNVYWTVVRA